MDSQWITSDTPVPGALKYSGVSPGHPPNIQFVDHYKECRIVLTVCIYTQGRPIDDFINPRNVVQLPVRYNDVLIPYQIQQRGEMIYTELVAHTVPYIFSKWVHPFVALTKSRRYFDNRILVPIHPFLYVPVGCNVGVNVNHMEVLQVLIKDNCLPVMVTQEGVWVDVPK